MTLAIVLAAAVVSVPQPRPPLKPQPAQVERQEAVRKLTTAVRPVTWAELKRRYK